MATIQDIAKAAGVSTSTVSRVLGGGAGVSSGTRSKVLAAIEQLNLDSAAPLPTIKDVAALAGVSIATVSNVLNGRAASAQNRKLVQEAVAQLNYRPNRMGRYLRREKSDTIIIAADALITECLQGAYTAAHELGYDILFMHTAISEYEDFINAFTYGAARGIIFINSYNLQLVRTLSKKYPVVQCGAYVDAPQSSVVSLDYEHAAYEMACVLLALGRRRIRFLTSYSSSIAPYYHVRHYKNGLLRALEAYQLDPSTVDIVDIGDFAYSANLSDHFTGINNILNLPEDSRPDALLCITPSCALIYADALLQAGLRIPEDIAIAALDSGSPVKMCHPNITAVQQPLYKMGYESVRRMSDLLEGKNPEARHILFAHKLELRGSTHKDLAPFGEIIK